ncbi:MAG: riboflavin synthase subunit alpha [Chitinophagales bacterium]
MYTGIVQATFEVSNVEKKQGLHTFHINFESLLEELQIGASVSIDGVCMTVTSIQDQSVSFDAMQETLKTTTLGSVNTGDFVNIERSAKQGAEVGGHIISGHIEGTAKIVASEASENNWMMEFQCTPKWMKYIVSKGFIAVNGASLTVNDATPEGTFRVHFIPETIRQTTFNNKKVGDLVNIEIDTQTKLIVDTVERYLSQRGV